MRRRTKLAIAAVGGTTTALLVPRPAIQRIVHNLRTCSAPDAAVYDLLVGMFLGSLYRRIARDIAAVQTSGRLLEVEPGPGHLAAETARATDLSIVGIDIDPAMVGRARRRVAHATAASRIRFEVGDVAALPFDDGSFDLVVSSFSLHHWPDAIASLCEIHRVLRPGGRAIIWDIHPVWTRLDTGGPSAAEAIAASPFGGARTAVVRWPLGLPAIVRFDLRRSPSGEAPSPDGEP